LVIEIPIERGIRAMNTALGKSAEIRMTEYEMFMIERVLTVFIRENKHRKDITDIKQLMNRIGNARLGLEA
jgi:hypothetical protein